MTSQTNSRYGFTFAVMVMLAVAVAGSVWAQGNGQQTEATRIDVAAIMTSADIANLPVLHIEDPI